MKRIPVIISLLSIFMLTSSAFGQAGTGSISGRITDSTGAVVVGAKVVVRNTGTGVGTQSVSNAEGLYSVLQLIPGKYDLEADASGFKKEVRTGLEVRVSDRLTQDFALAVGQQSESITVSGETPLLRTEDAQAGQVIDNSFIMNLPQLNRQSPLNLLGLSGNVQGDGGPGGTTRINGGRTSGIEFFMDGVPMSSGRGHAITNLQPNMDSLQEFKVVTNGVSAEYGRISGGYVEVVTKSGTNDYHGQAYEYMYNDMFNANSWAQNAIGNQKEHFRQNNYGFTLGGPVSIPKVYNGKNRTFFYFDYDVFRYKKTGTMVLNSVPTQAERGGDMSGTFGQGLTTMMYDPDGNQTPVLDANGKETGSWERTTLLGGDGKHVPQSRISPVSAAILKLLPAANRPAPAGCSSCNNYQSPQDATNDVNKLGLRIDHLINSNHRLSARLQLLDSNNGSTRTLGPLSTAATTAMDGGRFVSLNYDWTISPTLLLNVRAGANHDPVRSGNLLPASFNSASDLGLPGTYQQVLGSNNIPNIQVDFGAPTLWGNSASGNINAYTTYQAAATATKILNKHTVKFGFDMHKYYDNFTSMGSGTTTFMVNPVYQFSGDHGFGNAYGAVNTMGPFLLGINDWNTISGMQTRAMGMNYYAGFVQDDFKVSPKLTLNLGMRWDMESAATERHDKLYYWDPDMAPMFSTNSGWSWESALADAGLPANLPKPAWASNGYLKGGVCIANTEQCRGRSGQTVNPHQFAPRLGAAYQIDKKTVVRGSAGLMYLSTTGASSSFSSSNSSLSTGDSADAGWHASNDGQRHFISTWENPFPQAGSVTTYSRDVFKANQQSSKDPGVSVFGKDTHMPREYTWQITIQRELPMHFVVETGYSGNRGLGLLAPNSISQFPKSLLSPANQSWLTTMIASPNAGQTLETNITGSNQYIGILEYAYPYYGYVNILGANVGSSTFHSWNTRLERRFAQGLSFLMNYSYSRNLDDVGGPEASTGGINTAGTGGKTFQSVDTFHTTWGLSSIDQTHRLVATFLGELPFGRGKRWLGSPNTMGAKLLDGAFGGWAVGGTYNFHSGTAVQLNSSNCQNCTNVIKVETLFGSYATADHNLTNSNYSSDKQVLYSPADGTPTSGAIRRLDPSKVTDSQAFTYGNLPTVYDAIRNPSFYQVDLSLMKSFPLMKEGRYLQVRAEAQNAFNVRGYGAYNTKIGDQYFGLITGAGNDPRHIQLSARIVF